MTITGYNEAMIVYLLAIASPTYPMPASSYYNGRAKESWYQNNDPIYYGIKQWVGTSYGGPFFFTHYSFLGFDPRYKYDAYCNYFDNSRNISLLHQDPNWFSDTHIAIDQGTMVPMIENYRTELCWDLFMANPEIAPISHK